MRSSLPASRSLRLAAALLLLAPPAAAQAPAWEIEAANRSAQVRVSTTTSGPPPGSDSDTDGCEAAVITPGIPDLCFLEVDSALTSIGASVAEADYEVELEQGAFGASVSAASDVRSRVSVQDGSGFRSGVADSSSDFETTLVIHQPGTWSIDLALETNVLELDAPPVIPLVIVEGFFSVRKNGILVASETISDADPSPAVSASTSFVRRREPAAPGDVIAVSVGALSNLQGYEQASLEGVGSWSLQISAPEPARAHTDAVVLGALFALAGLRRAMRGSSKSGPRWPHSS